jgi:hypothetical protein
MLLEMPEVGNFLQLYEDDLAYSEVAWLTAHNAFTAGWKYAQQTLNFEQLYAYGVRSFMLDAHYGYGWQDGQVMLCHGDCGVLTLGQKMGAPVTLQSWFEQLYSILEQHPREIITLQLESYVRTTDIIALLNATSLQPYLLTTKDPNDVTLTLGEMRISKQRLVIFSDYAPERGEPSFKPLIGIYSTQSYKETKYSLRDFPGCEMRSDFRAAIDAPGIRLFTFNHFYTLSYGGVSLGYNTINSFQAIAKRVNFCEEAGLFPNFVTVDFIGEGDYGGARAIVESLMMGRHYQHMAHPQPLIAPSEVGSEESDFAAFVNWDSIALIAQTLHAGYFYYSYQLASPENKSYMAAVFSPAVTSLVWVFSDHIPHAMTTMIVSFTSSAASMMAYHVAKAKRD